MAKKLKPGSAADESKKMIFFPVVNMERIPLDIVKLLFHELSFTDQLTFASLTRRFWNGLKIIRCINKRITNRMIKWPIFCDLYRLENVSSNDLWNIGHLTELTILSLSSPLHLKLPSEISKLTSLEELDLRMIYYDPHDVKGRMERKIRKQRGWTQLSLNLRELVGLKKLTLDEFVFVDAQQIQSLRCLELSRIDYNIDIQFLTNLVSLRIFNCRKITQAQLATLTQLTYLRIMDCYQINDISMLTELRNLNISEGSSLPEDGLKTLINLTKLSADCFMAPERQRTFALNNLTNLKHLSVMGRSEIDYSSFYDLTQLTHLAISDTHSKTYIDFPYLTSLNIEFSIVTWLHSNLKTSLTKLNISDVVIPDLEKYTNLVELIICNDSIDQTTLDLMTTKLTKLDISDNPKITNVNRFVNLESLIAHDVQLTNDSINALTRLDLLDLTNSNGVTDIRFAVMLGELTINGVTTLKPAGVGPAIIEQLRYFRVDSKNTDWANYVKRPTYET